MYTVYTAYVYIYIYVCIYIHILDTFEMAIFASYQPVNQLANDMANELLGQQHCAVTLIMVSSGNGGILEWRYHL